VSVTCAKCKSDSLVLTKWGSYCPSCDYYHVSEPIKTDKTDHETFYWYTETFKRGKTHLIEPLSKVCRDLGYDRVGDVPLTLAKVVLANLEKTV